MVTVCSAVLPSPMTDCVLCCDFHHFNPWNLFVFCGTVAEIKRNCDQNGGLSCVMSWNSKELSGSSDSLNPHQGRMDPLVNMDTVLSWWCLSVSLDLTLRLLWIIWNFTWTWLFRNRLLTSLVASFQPFCCWSLFQTWATPVINKGINKRINTPKTHI